MARKFGRLKKNIFSDARALEKLCYVYFAFLSDPPWVGKECLSRLGMPRLGMRKLGVGKECTRVLKVAAGGVTDAGDTVRTVDYYKRVKMIQPPGRTARDCDVYMR